MGIPPVLKGAFVRRYWWRALAEAVGGERRANGQWGRRRRKGVMEQWNKRAKDQEAKEDRRIGAKEQNEASTARQQRSSSTEHNGGWRGGREG